MKTMHKTVAIAMSGGVDSSVAALLLKERGYTVFGLMLRLWTPPGGTENRCCSSSSIDDAGDVAAALGIPFYVLDAQSVFKKHIADYYIHSHAEGLTPNPCILCNRDIRFGYLLREAVLLGADYLATGHYVRRNRSENGMYELLRGVDPAKDQSYMLYRLNQRQLAKSLFPVGEYTKNVIREKAKMANLPVFNKKDSQDLCFLGNKSQKDFLKDHLPAVKNSGPIKLTTGEEIGQHEGLAFYTPGQRKGMHLSWHEPLYVLEKSYADNTLYVGGANDIYIDKLTARLNVFTADDVEFPCHADVQVRYRGRVTPARIERMKNKRLCVHFSEPIRDAAPGQSVVFYNGDTLIGGAFIDSLCRD